MKFDYMGKDNYSALYQAEQGEEISWATILYDRLILELQGKDEEVWYKIKDGAIACCIISCD